MIRMVQNSVQFGGFPSEDPNAHIANFLEICDTFKINGTTDNAIQLSTGGLFASTSTPSSSSVLSADLEQVDLSREVEATNAKELEKEEAKENKLPEKRHDLGSFVIPCVIGNLSINDTLADLGARINVMSYSLFVKLGLGETRPTRMSIQLADRSIKYPRGIVENALVKLDEFIFPVDFMILDMDGESSVPLILGRPFLATYRAMIDVCDGQLKLRVGDETVTFHLHNPISQSLEYNNVVYVVNVINDNIETQLQEVLVED
ncbi:uncharacterized protein LOC125369544 [Ricinus communis]|uniref:uncharacterized protein LOC125369544 n=1 Tax=Ricinus communis TaxID=3988 RepID=UPI00201A2DA4|nr:uncharacterized protein LOC125369544 [Ricinus communis]